MFHIHTQNKQISVWRQSNVGVKQQFFIENLTLLFDSKANTEKNKFVDCMFTDYGECCIHGLFHFRNLGITGHSSNY